MKKLNVLKTKKGIVLMLSVLVLGFSGIIWMSNSGLAKKQEQGRRTLVPRRAALSEKQNKEIFLNDKDVGRNGFIVDIAENGTKFVFDETPVFPDGLPAYGTEFITEGYIYRAGTLNGTNGVNADGSPEFPNLVIGRWTCRGWFTGDGAHSVTGPWVITHQYLDLDQTYGNTSITSDGFELVDLYIPVKRAITGGTGIYAKSRGEASQVLLGFNATSGVVLRVKFNIVPASD
jgi:hypothetical protein